MLLKSILFSSAFFLFSNISYAQTFVKMNGNINYGPGYSTAKVEFCVNSTVNGAFAYVYCKGQVNAVTNLGRFINQRVDGYLSVRHGASGSMCGFLSLAAVGVEVIANVMSDVYCSTSVTTEQPSYTTIRRSTALEATQCVVEARNNCLSYNGLTMWDVLEGKDASSRAEAKKIESSCYNIANTICQIP